MQPIIYEPKKEAKRIKIFVPYELIDLRSAIKKMNSSFWHPHQKLWSVVNTSENFECLKETLWQQSQNRKGHSLFTRKKTAPLNQASLEALFELEKALVLRQYSASTVKTYVQMFGVFLAKFMNRNLMTISKDEIEGFIYELITKHKISESYQNQLINAIKAYYEHAIKLPKGIL